MGSRRSADEKNRPAHRNRRVVLVRKKHCARTVTNRVETPFADERTKLSTNQKALKINLDPLRYGVFAQIGAGQEVARWFFKVGGAAGTISKSMSAYDMAGSDAIYGRCKRYVSRERLQNMLDYEHRLNLERLRPQAAVILLFSPSPIP